MLRNSGNSSLFSEGEFSKIITKLSQIDFNSSDKNSWQNISPFIIQAHSLANKQDQKKQLFIVLKEILSGMNRTGQILGMLGTRSEVKSFAKDYFDPMLDHMVSHYGLLAKLPEPDYLQLLVKKEYNSEHKAPIIAQYTAIEKFLQDNENEVNNFISLLNTYYENKVEFSFKNQVLHFYFDQSYLASCGSGETLSQQTLESIKNSWVSPEMVEMQKQIDEMQNKIKKIEDKIKQHKLTFETTNNKTIDEMVEKALETCKPYTPSVHFKK